VSYRSGRHFLQIPGPTNVPERVLRAISQATIDHRGPQFAELAQEVFGGLQKIFQTTGTVVIYPSSGSGAWEASLVNTLSPGDRVLMFETGYFATLWRDVALKLGLSVDFVPGDWRRGVDPAVVGSIQVLRQEIRMGRAQHMRAGRGGPDRGAAASFQGLELVGIEKIDLPVADRVHNGPMVPTAPPQTDQDGSLAAAVQKCHHFRPEFVQRCFGAMFEGHVAFGDRFVRNIPEDAADGGQADPFRQHAAEVFAVFQEDENLLEQVLGSFLSDVRNDPGSVHDAVYGAQAIQGPLDVGPHLLSVRIE
jgi:hypothetical protein